MPDVTSAEISSETPFTRLMSLAAHELRSPASVIGGYLRMLQSGMAGELSDQQRKMISEAEKSCARVVALVAELSDIGKIDSGSIALSETPIDIFQLISDVADGMHESDDREVRLQLRGEAVGALIKGDRGRLASALSVCVRAILREQPAATTVVADRRLASNADGLRATIVIAREDSLDETREAEPGPLDEFRGGLGLGLPLARRVIERYGGRVWSPALLEKKRQGLVVSVPVQPWDRSEGR
jgi:signal transduction histidine kinase